MKKVLFIMFIFCSCTPRDVRKTYDNRSEVRSKLEKTSCFVLNNVIVFRTHKNELINDYFLSKTNGSVVFFRDSISYGPTMFGNKNVRHSDAYKHEIEEIVGSKMKFIEHLEIREYQYNYYHEGDISIFLQSGYVVLYLPKTKKMSVHFKEVVLPCYHKIDEHWYFAGSFFY